MVLSLNKNKPYLRSADPGGKRNNLSWSKVVSRNIVSARHTPTTPPRSPYSTVDDNTSPAADIGNDFFPSGIVPWIKGLEEDSVLIDVTMIKDVNKLKDFLSSFNNDGQIHYFGRLLVERKYLQRTYIETAWDLNSTIYRQLCNTRLQLDDQTIIKGYNSLPSDAQIARVRVERLPLIHPDKLKEQMERRFAAFGKVLDVGFVTDRKCFVGQGYVILNLNPPNPGEIVFDKLSRVIDWDDGKRELLLTWDEMPPYCRFCQKEDHCRADCKDLVKLKNCFNCNEQGHLARDCPRRHYNPPAPPNKRVFVEQVASKEIIVTNKTRKTPNINSPIEELQQAPDESSSTTPDDSPSLDTDMTDASRQPKRTPSNDRDLEKERLDLIKRQRQGLSDPSHDANSNTTDPDTLTDPTSDMFTDDMIDDTTEATDGSPKLPFAPGISN